jgi:hypothetical protein
LKTKPIEKFGGVSIYGRWKPQKAGSVDENFGRWLQKTARLSGYQASNWQL